MNPIIPVWADLEMMIVVTVSRLLDQKKAYQSMEYAKIVGLLP